MSQSQRNSLTHCQHNKDSTFIKNQFYRILFYLPRSHPSSINNPKRNLQKSWNYTSIEHMAAMKQGTLNRVEALAKFAKIQKFQQIFHYFKLDSNIDYDSCESF